MILTIRVLPRAPRDTRRGRCLHVSRYSAESLLLTAVLSPPPSLMKLLSIFLTLSSVTEPLPFIFVAKKIRGWTARVVTKSHLVTLLDHTEEQLSPQIHVIREEKSLLGQRYQKRQVRVDNT